MLQLQQRSFVRRRLWASAPMLHAASAADYPCDSSRSSKANLTRISSWECIHVAKLLQQSSGGRVSTLPSSR
jgi:hypothetical protein